LVIAKQGRGHLMQVTRAGMTAVSMLDRVYPRDSVPPPENDGRAPDQESEENGTVSTSRPSLHAVPPQGEAAPEPPRNAPMKRNAADDARLGVIVNSHFDFIWRSLRRLGVPSTDVDDCAQQVFWVAARKLAMIQDGCERAFLFSTALRVASDARRSRMRRREVPLSSGGPSNGPTEDIIQPSDPAPRPDEIADRKRARALLDEVLAAMDIDLRAVFVLFELEEMPTQEIANLLEIPAGTVASRLRRAREEFQRLVARVQRAPKPIATIAPETGRAHARVGFASTTSLRGGKP
jgi:RNA polymerase sigma-70 factor (ECF subfamily)